MQDRPKELFSSNHNGLMGQTNGSQTSADNKKDRFRVKELVDGLKYLSENMDSLQGKSIRELEEAISLFNKAKSKHFPGSLQQDKSAQRCFSEEQTTKLLLQRQIEQLKSEMTEILVEAQTLRVKNIAKLAELQSQYIGDSQQTCEIYFNLHKFFSELEKNTASPAVINSMMSDIVEVFKTIDKCTRLRDRVSESLKDYLRGVEGVDISSEEEGANLDDDEQR